MHFKAGWLHAVVPGHYSGYAGKHSSTRRLALRSTIPETLVLERVVHSSLC